MVILMADTLTVLSHFPTMRTRRRPSSLVTIPYLSFISTLLKPAHRSLKLPKNSGTAVLSFHRLLTPAQVIWPNRPMQAAMVELVAPVDEQREEVSPVLEATADWAVPTLYLLFPDRTTCFLP